MDSRLAGIHQQEAACAICILSLTGREARLTEESSGLIADSAAYWDTLERLKTENAFGYSAVDLA